MPANVNCTLTASLIDGAGVAITSAKVSARRVDTHSLVGQTMATADLIEANSHASTGIVTLTLKAYDLFPVTYKITFPDKQYMYLRLPANAKSVGLGHVLCGRTPAKGVKDISDQFADVKFTGQDLASASALPAPTCDMHDISGTTTITSITATHFPSGKVLWLRTKGSLQINDGNNLSLTGNLSMTADDLLGLVYDGTNFTQIAAPPAI